LVERTRHDDLRAMSCDLGIAITILLALQEQAHVLRRDSTRRVVD
jgi:hypothetical protein